MLELDNRTPFPAAIVPGLTKEGCDTVTVVVKGTFSLVGRAGEPRPHDEQEEVLYSDTFYGEPGLSSLRHEADAYPAKKRTDIVLLGHAYAPRSGPSVDVRLVVGKVEKVVRVLGDRAWYRAGAGWEASDPLHFERVPLRWERAFGGVDRSNPDPSKHGREARNPIGAGFVAAESPERIDGLRLPNLEDPAALIRSPMDRPAPAGFGHVGRDFHPRVGFAGTHDEAWRRDVCPLLPADFDERYFHSAPSGQIAGRHLQGGEPVHVVGASASGELRFSVPARPIEVELSVREAVTAHAATLDSLRIEPDERRAVVTWKVTAPCPRSFLHIRRVRVRENKGAA